MCVIFNEDLEKMLFTINDYINTNFKDPDLSGKLKDHLADLKDAGKLSYCGCEGVFEIKIKADEVYVFMELAGTLYKFVVSIEPYYEKAAFSDAIDGYDDITENEYLESR